MARYSCALLVDCPDAQSALALVDRLSGVPRARMVMVGPREPWLAHARVDVKARTAATAADKAETWLRENAAGLLDGARIRRSATRVRMVGLFVWGTSDRQQDRWDDGGEAAGDRSRV